MRKLGSLQRDVLGSLKDWGYWYESCGWTWDGMHSTRRVMDSLVKRGSASVTHLSENPVNGSRLREGTEVYRITEQGRQELKK